MRTSENIEKQMSNGFFFLISCKNDVFWRNITIIHVCLNMWVPFSGSAFVQTDG